MNRLKFSIALLSASVLSSALSLQTTLGAGKTANTKLANTKPASPKKAAAPAPDVEPGLAIEYYNKGVMAGAAANYLQAIQYYEAARKADPQLLTVYLNEGGSYLKLKRTDLAIEILTKGIDQYKKNNEPNDVYFETLYQNRADAYLASNQPQKAVADYTQSLKHDVSQRGCIARAFRGSAYAELGEYQKAFDDFNAVLQLRQTDNATQTARVIANRMSQAARIQMQLDIAKVLSESAEYIAKHDYEKAIAQTNRALSMDPKNLTALLVRSTAYAAKHQFDKAEADLVLAEKQNPSDGKISMTAGMVHLSQGNCTKAVSDFETALARHYSSPAIYSGMASAQLELGRFDEALKSINEAIRLSPNDADSYNLRSLVYLVTDTPQNSIADANNYLEKTAWKGSHSADCFLRIYMLSRQIDQKEAASKILEEATINLKDDSWVQQVIGLFKNATDADKLEAEATDDAKKTDAKICIAIKSVIDGDNTKAEKLLKEVKVSGVRTADFYVTALVQLARMTGSYTPPKVEAS